MENTTIEKSYPIAFRKDDAEKLGLLLKNRRSVVLIGMKRVGISSFLRFFLSHDDIAKTYIRDEDHFFIPVDLNELVEREIFPFWILTFKRITDAVEKSELNRRIKKQIEIYFLDSIQTQDHFLTFDYIKKSLNLLTEAGFRTTIFFLRFDRLKDCATPELFDNLQGLLDASNRRLSYVFTSARPFDDLDPSVFKKHELSYFADNLYIKPASRNDTKIILDANREQRGINVAKNIEDDLIELVDGYSQYLQFALISLHENKKRIRSGSELKNLLLNDERILLQSEELWESLSEEEKEILFKIVNKKKLGHLEKKDADYLIKTGIFDERSKIFSPLFEDFIKSREAEKKREREVVELSKKEFLLLKFLEENLNEICEREQIIEAVWPEAETLGVSDWAIDRLVARLRGKLKNQSENFEIITVKTRGYKLINS